MRDRRRDRGPRRAEREEEDKAEEEEQIEVDSDTDADEYTASSDDGVDDADEAETLVEGECGVNDGHGDA